jgi:AraC-like DNA-binding protein/ActR/RegA family two-component response regulator
LHTLNGQLHEARRIAENANQLKTRFLANVSHELRTPLQIIIGLADTSLDMPELQKANPQLCQNVQHIQQSGMHLSRLIDDLLDLSRAEINALDLYPETLDVHGLLTNSFQSLRDSYNTSRAVGWHVALPERLPLIQADPVRLRQIVFNLLSNAARYTERGAITLGATVEPPFLHIWVADTGSGIALDQQERIFEPFASDHSRGRPRGVGLGLSITRRLVALHEGLLTLESRPGHGSTFHVYMPLPDLQGKPARAPDAAEPVLLLIGGQALLAPEIRALAGQQRLPLRRPRSLSELQTLLEAAQPVGILWDLAHPSADDGQMMALLRANPRFSTLPLLVFGQAQGDVPDLAMGVTEFVIKPISEATLQQSLQNISIEPPTVDRPLLIVDDDQQARSSYRALLAHMYPQHTIVEAVDGRMALNLLEQLCPSLIILDLVMPQVDGFDVLDAIRANPAIRHIPVMVLSGRLLSPADVQRLRHPQVVFQTKTLLSEPELTAQVERSLTGEGQLALGTSIFVKQAIAYMHQHYQRSFARRDIAAAVGINERYLTDIFHQELGLSPWEYLSRFRMVQAKALLRSSEATIEAIAAQVGFEDASYFRRAFRKIEGMSPSAYRERARWSVAAMDGIPGSG